MSEEECWKRNGGECFEVSSFFVHWRPETRVFLARKNFDRWIRCCLRTTKGVPDSREDRQGCHPVTASNENAHERLRLSRLDKAQDGIKESREGQGG
jgi:branched-subunit amino acid aminotransferase/4-amino-4-deoxychorismate lyase